MFPVAPSEGDLYVLGNTQYSYNATLDVWDVSGAISGDALLDLTTEVATKADLAQTVATSTIYTDATTSTQYKVYVDNGALVVEAI